MGHEGNFQMSTFGALIVLAMLVGYFFFAFGGLAPVFTDPAERARLAARPERAIFALIGLVLLGMLIVGICIPSLGEITLFSVGNYNIRIWGIGLIGSFAWMLLGWRSMNGWD
jgi:hypothetical protein